jgi:general secretion pathway protein B
MSYILEALRRAESERERKRGGVPGLHAQPVPNPSPDDGGERRGAPWGWIVTGLSIGVLLMILWRWWSVEPLVDEAALARAPVGGNVSPGSAQPPAAAAPTPPAPMEPAAPAAVAPAPGATPSAAPAPNTPPKGGAPTPTDEKSPRATKPAPPPRSTANVAPAARRVDGPAQAPASASGQPSTAAQPTPAPPVTTTAPPAANTRNAAPVPAPAAPPERLRTLAELPDDLRGSVPQLAFGGSVYSDTPAQRMVIFNGQVLREGDAVTNELQIEQIRPRSTVLRVRGQRFEMPF